MNAPITMNLYQRINEVRKEVDYVQKNKSVSTGGGSYKAVTHDEVTGVIRAHLVKHGVICVPSLVTSAVIIPPAKDGEVSKMIRYEATYDFRFVNADDPKEELVIRMEAHAMDNQDKAPGKAISYAKKYAVLKLFEIETGEEEESRHAEKGEFPLADYVASMEEAATLEDLKISYMAANKAAAAWPDASALRSLTNAKDNLKAKLEAKK